MLAGLATWQRQLSTDRVRLSDYSWAAMKYEPSPQEPRSGSELIAGSTLLCRFWSWAYSDLRNNVERGVFAEFLVGMALGSISGVRESWDAWDLLTSTGIKVEVKSAAYLQSWPTEKLSAIGFGGLRGRAWSPEDGYAAERTYRADVYVFALLTCTRHATLDPLAADQWEFYVASRAAVAAADARRLALSRVKEIANGPVTWADLADAVNAAARDAGGSGIA